jgi:hypothetical protein
VSAHLLEPFTPPDVVQRTVDPVTREVIAPRLTITEEQERAAVDWAVDQMERLRIYTVAVPVNWTRRPTTILTVVGHPEHLGKKIIAVLDRVSEEHDADGRPVDRSEPVRFERIQTELEDAWEQQDGLA